MAREMNGGVGEMSYANNSSLQRYTMLSSKPILEESIMRLYSDSSPSCIMKVADLGCSSGPNALLVTSNIIEIVHTTSNRLNREPPTFQFFLNDLFENDFNTILKSLPDFYKRLEQEKGHKFGSCFINATPGSFYGRLFPNNSINLFHSSNSLHWLSQDPLLGLTMEAETLNKGHCHITNTSPPAVCKAYLEQFQEGFKLFLKSRSEELVPGGGMVFVFLGRDETRRRRSIWEVVSITLNDMLLENLIEEAKLDSFNIPIYEPTAEEVRQVIEEEESFCLRRMEIITVPWHEGINEEGGDDYSVVDRNRSRADFISKYLRAGMEPLLKANLSAGVINELFVRFQKKLIQLMEVEKLEFVFLLMSMTKKCLKGVGGLV